MIKANKEIENYISNSAVFAQPILNHIRKLVIETCPDTKECIKWNFPHFIYRDNILCSMAAFKQHCAFIFWLASKMNDPKKILTRGNNKPAMGQLGRIASLKDLPSDKIMKDYLKEAMELIDSGAKKTSVPAKKDKKDIVVPAYFIKFLKKDKRALAAFDKLSYSHRKEYIEWISSAKKEETRQKRMEKAIKMMNEGS